MQRRTFLQLVSVTAIAQLTGCGGGGGGGMGSGTPPVAEADRTLGSASQSASTLPIPTLLTGVPNTPVFNLSLQAGNMAFLAGTTTPTYGINGNFLGPAIKVRNGDFVTLNVTNNLTETSTLHWHGLHVPGDMDGGPHQTIAAGATWTASFTVDQKAGTNWFHPHGEGQTGRMVYMGLAGLIIIEDTDTDALDLPKTWGVDDIPLILQDRLFKADGSFDYLPTMRDEMRGMLGDTLLVNGAVNANVNLPSKQVRLRLLNGSNARVYNLVFSDGRVFKQIATDQALVETPISLLTLKLAPGERAEIVVDFTPDAGKTLTLLDSTGRATLMTFNVVTSAIAATTLPATLTTLTHLSVAAAVNTRTFSLSMGTGMQFLINGLAMDMTRIDFTLIRNQVEIWEITNTMNLTHNFHVHGTHFEILERNGSATNVAVYEQGYKDVVLLNPFDTVKVILKMTHTATTPYMFHCHILEHEDRGMMGQFTVA
ncbi:multicopper oxidase domain-containing protein [Thiothrix sp.]|jgi:FtsP/CotA-like multicopper oxidase with cupredoxin domain|uniref:multicopper oxidase family protein n=1 Tax=Thiothrix sp. TaxID=1032 RepID=UPI0025808DA5|nr:multicopper oxidase domain-containing protein [Thiothrix sp.]